jgi:hypothetical protein
MRQLLSRLQVDDQLTGSKIRPFARPKPYVACLVANENLSERDRDQLGGAVA